MNLAEYLKQIQPMLNAVSGDERIAFFAVSLATDADVHLLSDVLGGRNNPSSTKANNKLRKKILRLLAAIENHHESKTISQDAGNLIRRCVTQIRKQHPNFDFHID